MKTYEKRAAEHFDMSDQLRLMERIFHEPAQTKNLRRKREKQEEAHLERFKAYKKEQRDKRQKAVNQEKAFAKLKATSQLQMMDRWPKGKFVVSLARTRI